MLALKSKELTHLSSNRCLFKKNRHQLLVSKIPIFKIKLTLIIYCRCRFKKSSRADRVLSTRSRPRGPRECNPLSLSRNSHCASPLATLSFPLTRDSLPPSLPHPRTPVAWRDRPNPAPLFLTVACPAAPPFPPVAGSARSGATPQSGVASGLPW